MGGRDLNSEAQRTGSTPDLFALPTRRARTSVGASDWPELHRAALHGLAGDIVRAIEPHTEADVAGILVQLLTAVGCAVGTRPHFVVGATLHHARIYNALVGRTASGRKGTAWDEVSRIVRLALLDARPRTTSGLSSGEGLIYAVRDPVVVQEAVRANGRRAGEVTGYQQVTADAGVADKRLLVVEPELAKALATASRDGNTLSAILRQAWDSGDIGVLTKSPYQATGAHIAINTHITADELRRGLNATEQANGFGNRFLWICVRRSKSLPDGGSLSDDDLAPLAARLRHAIEVGRGIGRMERTERAAVRWRQDYYAELTTERLGVFGAMVARGAPQVCRLALIYALLDGADAIDLCHLDAAMAVWRYSADSVRMIWGDATGDAVADAILAALRSRPDGLTRTEIRDARGRHGSGADTERALALLVAARMVEAAKRSTGGRPVEVWRAMGATEATERR